MDPVPLSTVLICAVNSSKVIGLTAAVLVLILLSAFFSATETAYTSSNRIRLKSLENSGSQRAKKVLKQLENYNKILNAVLIGNNIVNITASTLSAILFAELILNQAVAALVSTAVLMFLIMMFGEIMPKGMAKENAERFAMFAQPVVGFFTIILTPLIWLFNLWRKLYTPKNIATVTEDELLTIVEEAENDGEIDSHESLLIRSAIEFDDVELYDIMVPRVNIVAVRDSDSIQSIAGVFVETGFSRLPVYHDSLDAIIGILHEKDFYALLREKNDNIATQVKSGICLSRNMKISDALRTLQKAKVHMAIVVDEFGGTSGLVTMEDILEELVGEIYDEHDEEEVLLKKLDENNYIVLGAQNLEDMFEEMGIDLREEFESTSVGGWVTEQLKRIPLSGETFRYRDLEIIVTKANPRKVIEVKIRIESKPDDDESE